MRVLVLSPKSGKALDREEKVVVGTHAVPKEAAFYSRLQETKFLITAMEGKPGRISPYVPKIRCAY